MNITIKGTNYTLSDDIRTRVEDKIGSIGKLLGDDERTALVAVELERSEGHHEGNLYRAEVNVDTGKKLFRATAQEKTMEVAIDRVEGELAHELRKLKGKSRGIMRRTGAKMKSWMQGWRS